MLGISTKTTYKLLKEKKIKYITIGRTYKLTKIKLLEFFEVTVIQPQKYSCPCYNVLVMADEN